MATTITRAPLVGPHKLPTLLSILPNQGRLSVVRPAKSTRPNHVYLVTRSQLKFTSVTKPPQPEVVAQKAGAKVAATQGVKAVKEVRGHPMEGGRIRAHGKVWAMEMVNGTLRCPITKTPSNRIRDGLKQEWVAVDPTRLSGATREALEKWREIEAAHLQKRETFTQERATKIGQDKKERRQERVEIQKRRQAHLKSMKEVKVLY